MNRKRGKTKEDEGVRDRRRAILMKNEGANMLLKLALIFLQTLDNIIINRYE